MNARQKAKKYKKELNRLKRPKKLDKPMLTERQNADIVPLGVRMVFSDYALNHFDIETRTRFIRKNINSVLINDPVFMDCLEIREEYDSEHDLVTVFGCIDIVRRDK